MNEYNNNYPVKKTDLLNKGCSIYRRDNENRLVNNYMYMYNKASDSVSEAGFIQYTYDNNGKMASREFIPINVTDLSNPILYNYDSRGRVTEVRSRNRNVVFTYDSSKKTKVINMEIVETENVAEPKISVRCSYVYEHGNVVLYKEEKYEKSQFEWETIATDTITYDEQHHVTAFKDGRTGLYHNYKIRYNTFGQPVIRSADERGNEDTRTLPDGSVGTLSKIECKYYYETYVPAKQ
jgi:YD repeat-containing protein